MRSESKWILAMSVALVLSASVRAQEPAPEGAPMGGPMHGPGRGPGPFGESMELLGFGGMHGGRVVTGAPFTATAVAESRQTLADGTLITHKVQSNLYRDALGRFRREVTLPAIGPLTASGTPKSFVMIHDPVAQTAYVLEPDQKVAHAMPPRGNGGQPGPDAVAGKKPRVNDTNLKKESLGTQTINGVSAEGTRYTRTIPVGQIGNDKPVTIVKEEWYSSDLQLVVQSKHSDPFVGDSTYNVTNIQRNAPSASLFSVPADYVVKQGPPHGMAGMRRGHAHGADAPPPPDGPGI